MTGWIQLIMMIVGCFTTIVLYPWARQGRPLHVIIFTIAGLVCIGGAVWMFSGG